MNDPNGPYLVQNGFTASRRNLLHSATLCQLQSEPLPRQPLLTCPSCPALCHMPIRAPTDKRPKRPPCLPLRFTVDLLVIEMVALPPTTFKTRSWLRRRVLWGQRWRTMAEKLTTVRKFRGGIRIWKHWHQSDLKMNWTRRLCRWRIQRIVQMVKSQKCKRPH